MKEMTQQRWDVSENKGSTCRVGGCRHAVQAGLTSAHPSIPFTGATPAVRRPEGAGQVSGSPSPPSLLSTGEPGAFAQPGVPRALLLLGARGRDGQATRGAGFGSY